jgi:hypothetical protein
MIDQAQRAVQAYPDRRVLILVSHRNRFEAALRETQPQRVVDMQTWLQILPRAATQSSQ